jgi:uncharacterized membrane protein
MIDWNFEPIFQGYYVVVILGAALVLACLLIRLDRQLSLGKRLTLNTLRMLSVLALLLVMLRPGLTLTQRSAPIQSIAVMIDTSASMELPSGVATNSRWSVERQVLDELNDRSQSLGKELHWQLFAYDGQLRSLGGASEHSIVSSKAEPWTSFLPSSPNGMLTDVGRPLNEILTSAVEPPLMAVIWMGDGAQTTRGDTAEAQQSARQLSQLDIPLYLVGIGPRSGAEQTRDQILEGIPDQIDNAFAKNQVPIRGSLRAIGLQNRELVVRVFLVEENRSETLLNQLTLTPNQLDQSLPFQLTILAPDPGAYQLLVKAEGVDGEATLLNNEQTCFLNVRESGSRILYLEGQPRQEQTFIRRALADSPDLQIDARFIRETTREQWPVDLSELLKDDLFDCIIIGDLDAEALGPQTLTRIVELVQNGVGLIMLGGYHAYGSGGYQKSPLAAILPIDMEVVRQRFGQKIIESNHWLGEIPIAPRGIHPVNDLQTKAEDATASPPNAEAPLRDDPWKALKPLIGANRWQSIREGPGVQILAAGPQNQPLIVSSEAGRGRILCLAFDTSYQWWRQGRSDLHRQFWRQSVLWTMRREETQEGIRIKMPKRTLALGESSPYTLTWSPGSKQAPMPKDIELRWTLNGEDRGPLVPQSTGANVLTGQIMQVAKPGRYEIIARTKNSEAKSIETRLPFIVVDMAIEKLQAAPDWQLINQLAKLNESAGGRIVAPESIDEIFTAIAERRRTAIVESVQSYRLGDGPLDSWGAFMVLAILWGVQWSLRKAWNLP